MRKEILIYSLLLIFISSCNKSKIKNDLTRDNLKGNVKTITINYSGAFDKKEIHKYNTKGYEIYNEEQVSYSSSEEGTDSDALNKNIIEYSRDNNNNIIEEILTTQNPEGKHTVVIESKYDSENRLIENRKIDGNTIQYSKEFKYDYNGNIVLEKSKYNTNNEYITTEYAYLYDDNKNIIECLKDKDKTTFKYDKNNNKIYEKGGNINSGGSRELKYDANNNLVEEVNFSIQNKLDYTIKYEYRDNRLIEKRAYNNIGVLYSVTSYTEYDSIGNWIKQTKKEGSMIYNTERVIEYYSNIEINSDEKKVEESDKKEPKRDENNTSPESDKINDLQSTKDNGTLTLKEIQLTLLDEGPRKMELYLDKPDYAGLVCWCAKSYAIYFDKVRDNGKIKHLLIFYSLDKIVEIHAVNEGEKRYSGIHYIIVSKNGLKSNGLGFDTTSKPGSGIYE